MADEKDLQGDEDEIDGGGGKKKLIIIIVAALLLIILTAVAVLMLMGGDEEETPDGEPQEAAEEVFVPKDPLYHAFEPQFVVNLPPGGRARMLQLSMQVMAYEQEVIDYLKANDPMLRHHLFDLFSEQDGSTLYSRKGREALAEAIEKLLEAQMKENEMEADIQAVYFSELVLQ